MDKVTVYCDGSSLGNPGPGGVGIVMQCGAMRREISVGYRHTTNNRMEIRAMLHALGELKRPCEVLVITDSRYVIDAVEKWIPKWRKNGWKTTGRDGKSGSVKNRDLWEALIPFIGQHKITMQWIKGHSGHPENEICDQLAKKAASGPHREEDVGYETSKEEDR